MRTLKRHGLEGRVVFLRNKGFTFREVGEKTGITGSWANTIYKKAKTKKPKTRAVKGE